MKLSRPLLHTARIADAFLFWPVLMLVVWGELFAPQGLPVVGLINDKVLHFFAYFSLSWMSGAAFKNRAGMLAATFGLILMGGGLELVQGAIGRDASLGDEFANTAGALMGGALARVIVEPLRKRFAAK